MRLTGYGLSAKINQALDLIEPLLFVLLDHAFEDIDRGRGRGGILHRLGKCGQTIEREVILTWYRCAPFFDCERLGPRVMHL